MQIRKCMYNRVEEIEKETDHPASSASSPLCNINKTWTIWQLCASCYYIIQEQSHVAASIHNWKWDYINMRRRMKKRSYLVFYCCLASSHDSRSSSRRRRLCHSRCWLTSSWASGLETNWSNNSSTSLDACRSRGCQVTERPHTALFQWSDYFS